jgi:hypothetical protein
MIQLGNLIREIQSKQEKVVYFLAENTVINNKKDKQMSDGDLSQVQNAYQMTYSIQYDSKDVSPGRRNRTYLTNIPFHVNSDDMLGFQSSLSMCLEDNYQDPANVLDGTLITKANCLMATPSRINDDRMLVCKPYEKNALLCRHLTISEREAIMGFPPHYVEAPGKQVVFT